jgi:hypothetical protein
LAGKGEGSNMLGRAAVVTSDEGEVGLVTFWGNGPCESGCEMDVSVVRRGGLCA